MLTITHTDAQPIQISKSLMKLGTLGYGEFTPAFLTTSLVIRVRISLNPATTSLPNAPLVSYAPISMFPVRTQNRQDLPGLSPKLNLHRVYHFLPTEKTPNLTHIGCVCPWRTVRVSHE